MFAYFNKKGAGVGYEINLKYQLAPTLNLLQKNQENAVPLLLAINISPEHSVGEKVSKIGACK